MERLALPLSEIKLAGSEANGAMMFSGYGAAFNNIDFYGDIIEPGAFASFLADVKNGKQPWPAMLSQHGAWQITAEDMTPIGIWTEMAEDGKGLRVDGKLADTPRGREMYALMKMEPRSAIDGLSIGFIVKEWTPRSKPDEPRRRIKKVDLIEVSPVTFPANGKARVDSVKSVNELNTLAEAERFLRDACGFSRSEAVTFVSRVKGMSRSDSEVIAKIEEQGTRLFR